MEDWKKRLPDEVKVFSPENLFNADGTGLFLPITPEEEFCS